MAAYRELRFVGRLPIRLLLSPKPKVPFQFKGTQLSRCNFPRPKVRWCSTKAGSTSANSNQSHENDSNFRDTQQPLSEEEDRQKQEASVKRNILDSALDYVPALGWSVASLSEGAKARGLPGVAHGMFPRGGGDLLHHFVRECNAQLVEKLAREVQEEKEEEEREGGRRRRKTTPFIRDALEARLRMIIPFVGVWPQAMALTAVPENTKDHFSNLMQLMDDIWYHAGDRSVDFNWYTKRVSLAAIYKSAELCLVQDKSTDYQDTWTFIDRRLDDFGKMYKMRSAMEQTVSGISSLMAAAVTIGRNMAGVNDRNR